MAELNDTLVRGSLRVIGDTVVGNLNVSGSLTVNGYSVVTSAQFGGTYFESGNSSNGVHDANSITYNAHDWYSSNGPSTSLGATVNDGALYSQAYSDTWVAQIAQDYRNGRLFVRGKNNGTWSDWKRIAQYEELSDYVPKTSSARPGVTKLYRSDSNDPYNVQTYWDGTYWNLYGYYDNTAHAGCKVAYASSAGNADTVDNKHASDFVLSNSSITGATKCKITYDSKGLVTGGADLAASDIPDLSATYLPRVGGYLYPMTGALYVSGVGNSGTNVSITTEAGKNIVIAGSTLGSVFIDGAFKLGSPGAVGWTALATQSPPELQLPKNQIFYFPYTANADSRVLATQYWVGQQGYTSNTGTVTSVRVQAGAGLVSSQNTAQSGTLDTTISIDSDYKLPTTTEWDSKSSVSGVNDGTNWTSITINGTTMNIPSGGSGSLTLDNVSDGTTRKLNQVTIATGKAKLGVLVAGAKPFQTGDGYLELSDSSVAHGTTTYFRDKIIYGNNTLTLPTSAGTLALTSDIKHLYKHWVTFNVYGDIYFKFEFYSTSTTSSSTLTAANLLQMLQGKIVGAVNNNSGGGVMLSIHQAIQANTYQGFIYYASGTYIEYYPVSVNAAYVTIDDAGYNEV